MQSSSLSELFSFYIKGEADETQQEQFFQMVENPEYHAELKELMKNYLNSAEAELVMPEPLFRKILHHATGAGPEEIAAAGALSAMPATPVKSVFRKLLPYAAAVILVVAAALYLWTDGTRDAEKPVVARTSSDILPGGGKAVLTIDDGSDLILENEADGLLAEQNGTAVRKQNASLDYTENDGSAKNTIVYNTLSTPQGGQYKLTLPDGTKVWLNAASSIRFPVVFKGTERKVMITGEVYMEVTPNAAMPFIVDAKDNEIKVLGTRFNIDAYADENETQTTLFQGKVQVKKGSDSVLLQPGQQAVAKEKVTVRKTPNEEKTIAWKNGFFYFENDSLEEVMRELARWYKLTIKYESGIPDIIIAGSMNRNLKLSSVLDALENLGVRFRIDGKNTLVVIPSK